MNDENPEWRSDSVVPSYIWKWQRSKCFTRLHERTPDWGISVESGSFSFPSGLPIVSEEWRKFPNTEYAVSYIDRYETSKLVNDMHNKVSSGTFHHKQMVTKHLIRTFPWPFDTSCLASESFCIWKVGIARYKGGSWRGLPDSALSCNYFRQIINSILDSMDIFICN